MNEYQAYGRSTKSSLTNFLHQSSTPKRNHWLPRNSSLVENTASQLDRNSTSERLLGTKFPREKFCDDENQHSPSLVIVSKFEQDIIQLREQIERLILKEETSSYLNLTESQKLRNDVDRIEEINFRLRRALAERVTREQELLQKIENLQSDLRWRSEEFVNSKINEILSTYILRPEDIMRLIQDSISAVIQKKENIQQNSDISYTSERKMEKPQEELCANQTSAGIFPLNSDLGGKDEHLRNQNKISNQLTEQNSGSADFIKDEPMEEEEQECNQQADSNRFFDPTISGGASSNKVMADYFLSRENFSAENLFNNGAEQKSIWELVEFFESDNMSECKAMQQTKNPQKFKVNIDNQYNYRIEGRMVHDQNKKLGILINSSPFLWQHERTFGTKQKKSQSEGISNDTDTTCVITETDNKIPLCGLTTKDQNFKGLSKQAEKNSENDSKQIDLPKQRPQTFMSEKPLGNSGMFKANKVRLEEISEPTEVSVQNSELQKVALPNYSSEKVNYTCETKDPPYSIQLNCDNCSKEPTLRESCDDDRKIFSEIELQQLKEDSADSYMLDEFVSKLNGLVRVVEVCLKLQKKIQVRLLQTVQGIGAIDMNTDMPRAVRNGSLLETKNDPHSFLGEDLISNCLYTNTSTPHSDKSSNSMNTKLTDGENDEVHTRQHTVENSVGTRDAFLAPIQKTKLKHCQFETLKRKADNLWRHLRIIEANLKYQDAICYYLEACVQKKKAHADITEKENHDVSPDSTQIEIPEGSKLKQGKTSQLRNKERSIFSNARFEGSKSLLANIQKEKTRISNNFSKDLEGEVMKQWGHTHQDQMTISRGSDVREFKKIDSDFTQLDITPSGCNKTFDGNIGCKDVTKKYVGKSDLDTDSKNCQHTMRISPNTILKLIHKMERDITTLETQMTNVDLDPTEERKIFYLLKEILINKHRISRYLAK